MTLRFYMTALLFFSVFSVFTAQNSQAQYVQNEEVFTAGQPITVTVSNADTLLITYRPGSNISKTEYVPLSRKTYTWVPQTAGIIALSTPGGPVQTISVQFESLPIQGLIVLIVAGSILFGGAFAASVKLFGNTGPEMVANRPDT